MQYKSKKIVTNIFIGLILFLTIVLGFQAISLGIFLTSLLKIFNSFGILRILYVIFGISAIIVSIILAIKTFRR